MSTNPYQTPEGQLTTDDHAVGEIKFFSPSSRINRLRYWAHSMLFFFATLGVLAVAGLLAAFVSSTLGIVVGVIAYIAILVFSFILIIQRLHDLNKTGWMSLLSLIPLANIYLFVLVVFFKGTEGRNNYGLQTPPNKTWHWVLAFSWLLIFILGIVAAISLPAYQNYVQRSQGFDSSYESQETDAYPSEYSDENTSDSNMFSDEAIEDGVSYEHQADEIIEDDAIENEVSEDGIIDAIDEGSDDSESSEMQSDTPQ